MNIPFKSPLVVGYKGEVGSFLLNGLLKIMPKALNIWCFDINESLEERKYRIKLADYIFLCVPFQDTIPWLLEHKDLLEDKIIIEQASLKTSIYKDNRIKDLQIKPMHLLFRPSATPNSKDRRCAVVDNYFHLDVVETIEEMTNSSEMIFYASIEEHDRQMAAQQALVHRALLVLSELLERGADTYVSRKVCELALRIKEGDKDLYSAIQNNKDLPKVLKQFKDRLDNFKIEEFLE